MDNDNKMTEDLKTESKWALRGRLRSKAAWASIAGLIIVICGAFDLWDKIGIEQTALQAIFTAVGAVLTAFGVWNDPTEADRF